MNNTDNKTSNYSTLNKCRVCGSKELLTVLDLGEIYLSDFVDTSNSKKLFKAPLELVLCNGDCKLVQLKHTVSNEFMYREYWYLSGINKTMINELRNIVDSIKDKIKLTSNDYVIDIGANDGTLLRHYEKKINTIGFEPALNLKELNKNETTKIIPNFFNFEEWEKFYPNKKAKVVTAIGMFYDLDDPNTFVQDIVKCLHDNGLFIIQMMYLPLALERNAFDGICHEHLEYYSLSSLRFLLAKHDLIIDGLEIREHINEGSVRLFIKKTINKNLKLKKSYKDTLNLYIDKEKKLGLNDINIYKKFALRIKSAKEQTVNFFKDEIKNGKIIHGYAASTKGNTTLQYYELNKNTIETISDRNPKKWGKLTAGSLIPVISEEQSRAKKPDYYFILAWHFLNEFLHREEVFLANGGKFIVSMPSFKVIDAIEAKIILNKK